MPRVRRQARPRAKQKALYKYTAPPPPPPPRYDSRPVYVTAAQTKSRAEKVNVACQTDSGSTCARGSGDINRGDEHDLDVAEYGGRPAADTLDYGESQKFV